ncbi:lysostaphin resistance A-like protein [Streptomyces sp. NPDC090445]|uniref:CPBP family intramembrane glutamic endopeptidase n=1 Tax=Streptomyces sp. NPDC090445 TaxID=3365963 RepID=UPI0037FFF8DB
MAEISGADGTAERGPTGDGGGGGSSSFSSSSPFPIAAPADSPYPPAQAWAAPPQQWADGHQWADGQQWVGGYGGGTVPKVVAAPAGSRYHEQARNGRQGWWHRLGELLVVVAMLTVGMVVVTGVGLVVATALGAEPAPDDGDVLIADPLVDTALGLLVLAIGIPVVMLAVRWCGSRPAGTLASVAGRVRWRWLGLCAAVAFPFMAVQMGVLMLWEWLAEGDSVFEGDAPEPGKLLLGLALFVVLVPFQAGAEEFVFRGWLPQFFGGFLRSPWAGVAVASVLFALAHGFGGWSGFFLLLYSSLWWGWLVARTGGLEAVIAMHTANNVFSFGLALAFGQLADAGTAADAPWQALVVELVCAPVYCLVVARLAGARGLASVSGPDAVAVPAPVPAAGPGTV